jgi:TonB family protein
MKFLSILAAMLLLGTFTASSREPACSPDSAAEIAAVTGDRSAQGDTTRPPADFVDVDKEPVVIAKKEPVYPALALKAGMEGKVWVKIWVDKKGTPHEVVIMKSDAEIFNGPALEAARQFRFTPAYIKDKPVDVWVSVPFKFRIAEKREVEKANTDTVWGNFPRVIMKFAREILEGGSPDSDIVNALVPPGAQSIANGYLKPLVLALREQTEGKKTIEEQGRKVVFFTGGMADDGRSGYLVVRTEKTGKKPHFHTIVMQQGAGLVWKIVHWHTWHGSR